MATTRTTPTRRTRRQSWPTLSQFLAKNPQRTEAEWAKAMGVSKSFLSRIKAGTRQPSLPVAKRIAAIAGVPMESLIVDK